MKVRRLSKKNCERVTYCYLFNSICETNIPIEYFENSETWGLFDKQNNLCGGFTIVSKNMRVINQLPSVLKNAYKNNVSELTGYFLKSKNGRFKLKFMFFLRCFLHHKNRFIYAYDVDNTKLGKYYSYANPVRVFSGYLIYPKDEKTKEIKKENVEIITKFGIFLILLKSTIKKIFK